MCHSYRARYDCNHTSFTDRARTCAVQNEHLANPEARPSCNVKVPHPLCTITVHAKCTQCHQLDEKMDKLKSELRSLKKRVEKLEEARDSGKRCVERAHKTLGEKPRWSVERIRKLREVTSETNERIAQAFYEIDSGRNDGWESDESSKSDGSDGGVLLKAPSA